MYLYIFEDGDFMQSKRPPSTEDRAAILDGILTVIVYQEGVFKGVEPDGETYTLETVSYLTAEERKEARDTGRS